MREASKALRSALINYNVSPFLFSEIENQDMSETFKTITSPSGNTLLHIAAAGSIRNHENMAMATTLARKYPFLITMQNSKGDTPLHVAARDGMLQTAKILVDCAKRMTSSSQIDVKFLMEMKNVRGNTALHEALNALQDAKKDKNKPKEDGVTSLDSLARSLVSEDPNASYLMNVDCKSPLYLAVESKNEDILEYILEALPVNDDCDAKLEGKSPVKVAIELQKLGLLKMMHDKQPALLLIQDEQMNTPMHWAASVDHLEGVRFLYEINPDSVLQKNEEGLYPFHLASANGCVPVMGEFLEKENMPHPNELFNNKGQNILHVAAKKGRDVSVTHILEASDLTDKLINEMDDDGNTPLHLAALYGHYFVAVILGKDGRAESDIINFYGQTAYDIAEQQYAKIIPEFSENDDDMMTLLVLLIVYIRDQLFQPGRTSFGNLLKLIDNLGRTSNATPVNQKAMKDRINNLLVVAALIAGASFAASVQMSSSHSESQTNTTASIIIRGAGAAPFALPCSNGHGGCDESQKKQRTWIKVFTVSNTIAMYTSITAAVLLCSLQLLNTKLASLEFSFASLSTVIALYTSCIAFYASIHMSTYTGREFIVVMAAIQGWILLFRLPRFIFPFQGEKRYILFVYAFRLASLYFLNRIRISQKKTRR
ncbi:ANK REP REGION domain-containing protein [Citrus sinensis]|uniref:ANK REP REGION domain-containing protein n=1 Tax=Citrus sinensis TaxID=2711 RepID=A0ACB8MAQ7_CITSI|nr:ANK REP REGION domain-containing protein [Citrus sinensis]